MIPLHIQLTILNELSSNDNMVLLEIFCSPITAILQLSNNFINWKKYSNILISQKLTDNYQNYNSITNNAQEIKNIMPTS